MESHQKVEATTATVQVVKDDAASVSGEGATTVLERAVSPTVEEPLARIDPIQLLPIFKGDLERTKAKLPNVRVESLKTLSRVFQSLLYSWTPQHNHPQFLESIKLYVNLLATYRQSQRVNEPLKSELGLMTDTEITDCGLSDLVRMSDVTLRDFLKSPRSVRVRSTLYPVANELKSVWIAEGQEHSQRAKALRARKAKGLALKFNPSSADLNLTPVLEETMAPLLPKPDVEQSKAHVVEELTQTIHTVAASARCEVFGSAANGFGFATSDIDIALHPDDFAHLNSDELRKSIKLQSVLADLGFKEREASASGTESAEEWLAQIKPEGLIVLKAGEAFRESNLFDDVETVCTARVPVVKMVHRATKLQCDVAVGNALAVHNTALLRAYANLSPQARTMILGVKLWAKRRGIGDASQGFLSSYAWTLLALFYLQRCPPSLGGPALPNLQTCAAVVPSEIVETTIEGFKLRYLTGQPDSAVMSKCVNQGSAGALLRGFFAFYVSHFNLQNDAINFEESQKIPKKGNDVTKWRFSIIDPFELTHDLGTTLSGRRAQTIISEEIYRAFETVSSPSNLTASGWTQEQAREAVAKLLSSSDAVQGARIGSRPCMHCGEATHRTKQCSSFSTELLETQGCYICGSKSHRARDCHIKEAERQINKNTASKQTICRACKQKGHIAKDCPQKVTQAKVLPKLDLTAMKKVPAKDTVANGKQAQAKSPNANESGKQQRRISTKATRTVAVAVAEAAILSLDDDFNEDKTPPPPPQVAGAASLLPTSASTEHEHSSEKKKNAPKKEQRKPDAEKQPLTTTTAEGSKKFDRGSRDHNKKSLNVPQPSNTSVPADVKQAENEAAPSTTGKERPQGSSKERAKKHADLHQPTSGPIAQESTQTPADASHKKRKDFVKHQSEAKPSAPLEAKAPKSEPSQVAPEPSKHAHAKHHQRKGDSAQISGEQGERKRPVPSAGSTKATDSVVPTVNEAVPRGAHKHNQGKDKRGFEEYNGKQQSAKVEGRKEPPQISFGEDSPSASQVSKMQQEPGAKLKETPGDSGDRHHASSGDGEKKKGGDFSKDANKSHGRGRGSSDQSQKSPRFSSFVHQQHSTPSVKGFPSPVQAALDASRRAFQRVPNHQPVFTLGETAFTSNQTPTKPGTTFSLQKPVSHDQRFPRKEDFPVLNAQSAKKAVPDPTSTAAPGGFSYAAAAMHAPVSKVEAPQIQEKDLTASPKVERPVSEFQTQSYSRSREQQQQHVQSMKAAAHVATSLFSAPMPLPTQPMPLSSGSQQPVGSTTAPGASHAPALTIPTLSPHLTGPAVQQMPEPSKPSKKQDWAELEEQEDARKAATQQALSSAANLPSVSGPERLYRAGGNAYSFQELQRRSLEHKQAIIQQTQPKEATARFSAPPPAFDSASLSKPLPKPVLPWDEQKSSLKEKQPSPPPSANPLLPPSTVTLPPLPGYDASVPLPPRFSLPPPDKV